MELVAAMALLTLLLVPALRALLGVGRQSAAVVEHAAAQAGVRTGLLLAQAELRELGADAFGADVLRLSPDSVTYRAARGFGITCAILATQVRILDAPPLPFSALRAISPGRDTLLLFVEGDPLTSADDHWVHAPVLSVGSGSCGGSPALAVGTTDLTFLLPTGALSDLVPGGPVRTFEVVRLAEYASGGQRWLGAASLSGGELIQPVAGPLVGEGMALEFFDAAGAPTASSAAVRSMRITLEGASERAVSRIWSAGPSAFVVETVATRLFLRNLAP